MMKRTLNDVHQQFAEFFGSRALAPYAYLVSQKLSEGHICLDLGSAASEVLPPGYEAVSHPEAVLARQRAVGAPGDNQPFILDGSRLYLARYFRYETRILEGIGRLLEAEAPLRQARQQALRDNQDAIRALFPPRGPQQATDWQLAGVLLGVLNNLTLLTGGPGTGKTTTLTRLLRVLYRVEPLTTVALAAPTGKAAMRMAESLQATLAGEEDATAEKIRSLKPVTLHRLLKVVPGTPRFHHNRDNPLPEAVVVVDEASMADAPLMAKLLDAIRPGSRLILLGDKNQLASVEAGSILGDLCEYERRINVTDAATAEALSPLCSVPQATTADPLAGHIIQLKESHRFGEDSEIGRLSRHILAGEPEAITSAQDVQIDTTYNADTMEAFLAGFRAFTREPDIARAYRIFNELRILCAVREGPRGVYRLNELAEQYLREHGLISRGKDIFYENRPVIIGRNYYEAGLFNGDTGIIRKDEAGNPKAWFPDPESPGTMRGIPPHYIAEAETVYAMTIHKSQGSEFDRVLVVLPEEDPRGFLTRELLYTAVTRARKQVIIQGDSAVMAAMIGRRVRRVSGINERLEADFLTTTTN